MKIEYRLSDGTALMNGTRVSVPAFAMAVDTVAKRNSVAIEFRGWDHPYPYAVELTEAHKADVQAERETIRARMTAQTDARMTERRCTKCGRTGMFTTARSVCDDCA
jgi:hypothetical protein